MYGTSHVASTTSIDVARRQYISTTSAFGPPEKTVDAYQFSCAQNKRASPHQDVPITGLSKPANSAISHLPLKDRSTRGNGQAFSTAKSDLTPGSAGCEASIIKFIGNENETEDDRSSAFVANDREAQRVASLLAFHKEKQHSLPSAAENPLLSLSHPKYGLPAALTHNFRELGVRSIYPWQSSCLLGQGLLDGSRNLVYSAPTGGGKSLVADILMLKRVIDDPTKKAILVLPYVALVQEKLHWMRRLVEGVSKHVLSASSPSGSPQMGEAPWQKSHTASIRVTGFFGGNKVKVRFEDTDIAICTIEKANTLINSAIEGQSINNLGIVVIDELHMVIDEHRGYLLELMASKLLSLAQKIQLVGMSATLGDFALTDQNVEMIAKWLNAKYYSTKYAPVPVKEFLVYENLIYPTASSSAFYHTASQLVRPSQDPTQGEQQNPFANLKANRQIMDSWSLAKGCVASSINNAVVALAVETARAGHGALVFCGSRQKAQFMANLISEAMPDDSVLIPDALEKRLDLMVELRSLPIGLDDTLGRTLMRGVAFHHAGLTSEERELIATAYDQGILRVIVATCSLAAGVNLPARRVIIHGARMGRDLIGPAMLRQMRGRAGRKGKDDIGESYLCCQAEDLQDVATLLEADMPPAESSMTKDSRGLRRALLEVITIRLATHIEAIKDYVSKTLLFHSGVKRDELDKMITVTINDLMQDGLISMDEYGGYLASDLSQAIVASSLTPEDGIFVHSELRRALQAFVMDGEMHMFYTFTPVHNPGFIEIKWSIFRTEMDKLDESGMRVLRLVGINPVLINRWANSAKALPETTPEEISMARVYRRFYSALQLRDLCNEMPIHAVARKYEVPRGFVQTLTQLCDGFATGMILFCDKMGWGMLKAALEHTSDRLKAGARADLLDLAKIPFVKSRTARVFWENGFRSLRAVAEARPDDIVPILAMIHPRRSGVFDEDDFRLSVKLGRKAEMIVDAACRIWERQLQVEIETDS